MEPTSGQFSSIYRKGEDQSGLKKRALDQNIQEMSITRGMTSEQRYNRETAQGVTGAKNAVNLKATVAEATQSPDTLGGPVSGAALSKLKAKKSENKKTTEREMKRR
jgi:hypothetical protein